MVKIFGTILDIPLQIYDKESGIKRFSENPCINTEIFINPSI